MAKIVHSDESKEVKETIAAEESKVAEAAAKVPKPVKVEEPKVEQTFPDRMRCYGSFTSHDKKDMCLTYADGKYSKTFLKSKGIPCPRRKK